MKQKTKKEQSKLKGLKLIHLRGNKQKKKKVERRAKGTKRTTDEIHGTSCILRTSSCNFFLLRQKNTSTKTTTQRTAN